MDNTTKDSKLRRFDSHNRGFNSVEEYVKTLNGKHPIERVLIANNGIGAVKAIRSIRRWSYEMFADEKKVQFVVMATPEDLRANAEYIRMADQVVEVPGGSNNNNYANVMLIVEIAERWKVDAVWAGWGHASENPLLPDSLERTDRKVIFIGPPGRPMRALGDKIGSTIIAQSANVPTIAWNGDGITVNYQENGQIPDSTYQKANVTTVEDAIRQCKRIGFPVMIKASEGGGGKGIRKVETEEAVAASFTAVQGEIPGSPIFVMKLAPKSRHLEVQLLADQYGEAIALSGRDCSIQRRHQKIVEEGPVLAPPSHVWVEMERAATRLAKEVSYVNAGTVEYLYTEENEEAKAQFYFLELNPRLQVEHPVTEMITGVNLPAAQLQVAMGIPLHRIPDVRRLYKKAPFEADSIDFEIEEQAPPHGHVIAARITAENPDEGFQPTSGAIEELNFRSTPDVWGYFSVDSSGRVHEFADSQIGHLFSWGQTRHRARKNMILALKELSIRGDIRTTVEYLVKMMESDDFSNNNLSTSWLDQRISKHDEVSLVGRPDPIMVVLTGAVCSAYQSSQSRMEEYTSQLNRGQLPPADLLEQTDKIELIYQGVKYCLDVSRSGERTFTIHCNGSYVQSDVRLLSDGGYLVLLHGKSHVAYATKEAGGLRLVIDGITCLFTNEYDPTRLTTNAAGKLARYLVKDGAKLRRGTPFAEVEVMKMYMPLLTAESGVVHFVKPEGSVLNPGDCLATMTLDDPSCVKKSKVYDGILPDGANTKIGFNKPLHLLRDALEKIETCLQGYIVPDDILSRAIVNFQKALENPELPIDEVSEVLSVLTGRMPATLHEAISKNLKKYKEDLDSGKSVHFNAKTMQNLISQYQAQLKDENERTTFSTSVKPLVDVVDLHLDGIRSRHVGVIHQLFDQYLQVENSFDQERPISDIISDLRRGHSEDLELVYAISRSHCALKKKNNVMLEILNTVQKFCGMGNKELEKPEKEKRVSPNSGRISDYVPLLHKIAKLKSSEYSLISLEARHLLIDQNLPSYYQRLNEVERILTDAALATSDKRKDIMSRLTNQAQPIFDLLISLLSNNSDENVRSCIFEMYIRRIYRSYDIDAVSTGSTDHFSFCQFEFHANPAEVVDVGMSHSESYDDLSKMNRRTSINSNNGNTSDSDTEQYISLPKDIKRHGIMASFSSIESLKQHFHSILSLFPQPPGSVGSNEPTSVLHFVVLNDDHEEDALIKLITAFLQENKSILNANCIRRLTFAVRPPATLKINAERYPGIYTFRHGSDFEEDSIVRHMEAPLAFMLDLKRLSKYKVQTIQADNKNIHLYLGTPRRSALQKEQIKTPSRKRFFVRAVVRDTGRLEHFNSEFDAHPGPERMFVDALNALDIAMGNYGDSSIGNNHVFLSVLPEAVVNPQYIEAVIRILAHRYSDTLKRLRVSHVEFKINAKFTEKDPKIPVRLVASNPTGYVLRVDAYVEARDTINPSRIIFTSIGEAGKGELDGLPITTPYPLTYKFEQKRDLAKRMSDTLYVYDFVELLEHALVRTWRRYMKERPSQSRNSTIPKTLLKSTELVLDNDQLTEIDRPAGKNTIGMVAWILTLCTPEYPTGRKIVVIANDITFKAGSFGTQEDRLFELASIYARKHGYPRIYLAANAGARIGMAETVKSKYRVAWNDSSDPTKGFKYLYLTSEDYEELSRKHAINAECHTVEGIKRYILTDVIGEEVDLGVENLRGSGAIAGETSRAFNDIFTLTYVAGRSVGIGAYLVRLGHRTIQKTTHSPIILTGFQALNKLMGKDVYTSNDQLGGIKIMHTNGVTHQTVEDHMEGIASILQWLSFVPSIRSAPLPMLDITGVDMVERDITFSPGKTPYDPRHLLTGCMDDTTKTWLSGFMDRGSFIETMSGWAKTVVTGRARLGGIPLAAIVTEVRTAEKITPADPAAPKTQESLVQQAGQVWFPDSAYKTAQAIRDFNGEDLPLMIFANWRGFSGGQRDMFDEVLKFGACIVDGLVNYKQPVFVYIPPHAELRGGAWVVVDPTINLDVMEMYADHNGRGGVLEPAGLIEIKYRKKDLIKTIHRLDKPIQELKRQLEQSLTSTEREECEAAISARELLLLPIYTQIATQFADLHDTPGRMKAKKAIREIVSWKRARSYFYWRLKRRLSEFEIRRQILNASNDSITFRETEEQLMTWFKDASQNGKTRKTINPDDSLESLWNDDRLVYSWLLDEKKSIEHEIEILNQERIANSVETLGSECPKAAVKGILNMINSLNDEDRQEVITSLRRGSIFGGSLPTTSMDFLSNANFHD